MIKSLALLLSATLVCSATPALACSVSSEYRVPTNLELATEAEVIVLGQVIGGTPAEGVSSDNASIRVRPVAMLKGDLPGDPLELRGLFLADEKNGVLSNPYELEGAHPLAWIGGCIRYMFPADTQVLFFLKRHEGGRWGPAGGPFSRWAEDVIDPEGPWPVLTALYVRAAALPATERKTLLEAERERLLEKANDPVARLMAADITRQLAGPNKPLRGGLSEAEDTPVEDAEPTN